jgi:heme A synthase
MAEDLFTTIISEVSLHRTIAEITGLLILIAIFLVLVTKVLKRKKATLGASLEPRVEKTTTTKTFSEPQIKKQVDSETVSEPQIKKQVVAETVSEP